MIHEASRRAVGEILLDGPEQAGPDGHAVLIHPRVAVTCAHVLGTGEQPPPGSVRVRFGNLAFDGTARVVAWRPFDPALSSGSDLALLELEGAERLPDDAHVKLDPSTKLHQGSGVVSLDFLGPLPEGDAKSGTVRGRTDTMISLAGEYFIEPGMSGTGLFLPNAGERLLGLVSGLPERTGQTSGYAIPSEHISLLLEDWRRETPTTAREDAAVLGTMLALVVGLLGDNIGNLIRDFGERGLRALGRPPEEWGEGDLIALADLQLELVEAFDPDLGQRTGIPIPSALVEVLARLRELLAEKAAAPLSSEPVELTEAMMALLDQAMLATQELLLQEDWPEEARDALEQLRRNLSAALMKGSVSFDRLSDRSQRARRLAGKPFTSGARVIMAAIGCRPELAPPGAVFIDLNEPWCPEMVVIPACPDGFLMGSPEDELERHESEGPQHEVRIGTSFALARFALTFDEYDAFCAETGREKPDDNGWGRGRRPVINVSWMDAQDYRVWLNGKVGRDVYRLPSEAEWEYACRGDASGRNQTPFNPVVANGEGQVGRYITAEEANFEARKTYNGSPEGEFRGQTVPVDQDGFRPNGFGLWQMHGNVWEWTADRWHDDYDRAPTDGSPWLREEGGEIARRVVRGGSWDGIPSTLRSARRFWFVPDGRSNALGFRPTRTLTS